MPYRQTSLPLSVDEAVTVVWSGWTEDMLLSFVRSTARMCGWRFYHTKFSLKSDAGFPDCVLVNETNGRLIFSELKREGKWPTEGRFSRGVVPRWITGQQEWLKALATVPCAEVFLWWPSDGHDIATILSDGADKGMACVRRTREYLHGPLPAVGAVGAQLRADDPAHLGGRRPRRTATDVDAAGGRGVPRRPPLAR